MLTVCVYNTVTEERRRCLRLSMMMAFELRSLYLLFTAVPYCTVFVSYIQSINNNRTVPPDLF